MLVVVHPPPTPRSGGDGGGGDPPGRRPPARRGRKGRSLVAEQLLQVAELPIRRIHPARLPVLFFFSFQGEGCPLSGKHVPFGGEAAGCPQARPPHHPLPLVFFAPASASGCCVCVRCPASTGQQREGPREVQQRNAHLLYVKCILVSPLQARPSPWLFVIGEPGIHCPSRVGLCQMLLMRLTRHGQEFLEPRLELCSCFGGQHPLLGVGATAEPGPLPNLGTTVPLALLHCRCSGCVSLHCCPQPPW